MTELRRSRDCASREHRVLANAVSQLYPSRSLPNGYRQILYRGEWQTVTPAETPLIDPWAKQPATPASAIFAAEGGDAGDNARFAALLVTLAIWLALTCGGYALLDVIGGLAGLIGGGFLAVMFYDWSQR